ncbi:unnamed protein product [Anisakis simplex]|uniref:Transmembrane protein n=1 Tax=Anisakis simplex TaxID=6269 RepID=A0A0M3J1I2_ANISI|nr:unnamed protein product [Anisakis simplex]
MYRLAICAASSAFIGLVFFVVGLIGVANESVYSRARDWIFLSFGLAMLTIGFSLLLLCRIRINIARQRQTQSRHRRHRRRGTRPVNGHDPLSVWATDLSDWNFYTSQPPPDYVEALHCSPSLVPQRRATVSAANPPPYAPSEGVTRQQSRSTLI